MGYDRRRFLASAVAGIGTTAGQRLAMAATDTGPAGLPVGTLESATLDTLPGKLPLIKRSWRPPNFETPTRYFGEAFTPNDAFFVRYHLSNIPPVDASQWRLAIGGEAAERPVEFSLAELQRDFETVEIAAVCLCSGNRRGLSDPHVAGVQWGNGAMGNARWKGVRLKDVLAKAGLKAGALEVAFEGADGAVNEKTPDFVKSIPVWKALDENTLIAWAMNGEPLPWVHGHPLRLVVPGWVGSASTKWLHTLTVLETPFKGTYMDSSYVVPRFPVEPGQKMPAGTLSTQAWPVKSIITSPAPNARINTTGRLVVRGHAWVGEGAVERVEISTDEGKSWQRAALAGAKDKYAWRNFTYEFQPRQPGYQTFIARAWDDQGGVQPAVSTWNPLGYFWNGWHRVGVVVEG